MAILSTPNRGYPYASLSETPNVPRDVAALALAVDTDVNNMLPVGSIVAFAGSTTPPGWLLCNGASFSAGTYPTLAAVLGGTPTLPNLVDRFLKGSTTAGTSGGSSQIEIANMPSHNHGGVSGDMSANATHTHSGYTTTNGAHTHSTQLNTRGTYQGGGSNFWAAYWDGSYTIGGSSAGDHAHYLVVNEATTQHHHNVYSEGGSQPYNPPFYTVRYIIKAQ